MVQHNNPTQQLVEYIDKLLNEPSAPDIPKELAEIEGLLSIHTSIVAIRSSLYKLSQGDFSETTALNGFTAGCLKALQANLRHLTWQIQQVKHNGSNQCLDFMGEFASAFNSMVMQLSNTIYELKKKETALLELTKKQEKKAELRKRAMRALRQSEAKFRYLSERDPFTECLNRRSFFSLAERSLQNLTRTRIPSAIALMDIDSFKLLNDTYGHLNGDIALKHVVDTARSKLRNVDLIGRYGGEEFILFFCGVDIKQAVIAAERIRHAIAASLVSFATGENIAITVSIGVCGILPEWPGRRTIQYLKKITEKADNALYKAKSEGKNRVCCADLSPPSLDNPIDLI